MTLNLKANKSYRLVPALEFGRKLGFANLFTPKPVSICKRKFATSAFTIFHSVRHELQTRACVQKNSKRQKPRNHEVFLGLINVTSRLSTAA